MCGRLCALADQTAVWILWNHQELPHGGRQSLLLRGVQHARGKHWLLSTFASAGCTVTMPFRTAAVHLVVFVMQLYVGMPVCCHCDCTGS